jgi:hypothetical protein
MPEDPEVPTWQFDTDVYGNSYPSHVFVCGEDASYTELWFNEKGELWKWDIRDEDGDVKRRGEGAPSSRPTLIDDGPPLAEVGPYPDFVRGACAACTGVQEARNFAAEDLLYILAEMNAQAATYAKSRQTSLDTGVAGQDLPPIRMRYEVLEEARREKLSTDGEVEEWRLTCQQGPNRCTEDFTW